MWRPLPRLLAVAIPAAPRVASPSLASVRALPVAPRAASPTHGIVSNAGGPRAAYLSVASICYARGGPPTPPSRGGFGAYADLQWIDLGVALARLLAAAAAAGMAFRLACRGPRWASALRSFATAAPRSQSARSSALRACTTAYCSCPTPVLHQSCSAMCHAAMDFKGTGRNLIGNIQEDEHRDHGQHDDDGEGDPLQIQYLNPETGQLEVMAVERRVFNRARDKTTGRYQP